MNNQSLILRVEWSGVSILLPGDTNREGYEDLSEDSVRANIFKLGHHGQKDSISDELLEKISPEIAVCCASSDQKYHSADEKVMIQLEKSGVKIFFSDCPPVMGKQVPPHQALVFRIEEGEIKEKKYISKEKAYESEI